MANKTPLLLRIPLIAREMRATQTWQKQWIKKFSLQTWEDNEPPTEWNVPLGSTQRERQGPAPREPMVKQTTNYTKHTKARWIFTSLNMKDHGSQNPLWNEVWKFYGMRLEILFSADECNPTGKVGITIVLNKDLIQMDGVEVTNLILGQAMLARIPWHGGGFFNWLAVYVLNDEQESKRM
ncbi:hypothetical protein EDD18DRAFT_1102069 [Armillaria luteobubalina]|uniref:Uncharacterized protein n=1 Tax=Armillaria luteobubalina TaxID=153913 RepID=A0AA39V0Y2_9AGAR|nr:hypothetical protein EDD18DRAFT_1102069 [Armillaria luteobubalina]